MVVISHRRKKSRVVVNHLDGEVEELIALGEMSFLSVRFGSAGKRMMSVPKQGHATERLEQG